MMETVRTMRAIALDAFGGLDALTLQTLPIPEIAPDEVLICVEIAGVGEWDPFEREGGYAEATGIEPTFPYVLGSEGAGTIVAVGEEAHRFNVGDRVYSPAFLNPKGGFYAQYAAVNADLVALTPSHITTKAAGVMSGVGITALRGLDDVLGLKKGESIMIFGASGGIGHIAVQIAKRIGARVFAVASGEDGVALAKQLGADVAIDGHTHDVLNSLRTFAPDGVDTVLLTAGGEQAENALNGVHSDGRVAYPNGIEPVPKEREHVKITGYNGEPEPNIIKRFSHFVDAGPLVAHVDRIFPLEQTAEAQQALEEHYLGKLALEIGC
jgi:NADPH:quinone reductase-like Zn-dependent oxidoreductase